MRRVSIYLLMVLVLSVVNFASAKEIPLELAIKINAPLRKAMRMDSEEIRQKSTYPERFSGLENKDGDVYAHCFIESSFSAEELKDIGVAVRSGRNGVYTCTIPLDDIRNTASFSEISRISLSTRQEYQLDVSTGDSGDMLLRLGCNSRAAQGIADGEGVIIGIVDSGIDWSHGDFIADPDGSGGSRIINVWDQTLTPQSGESSPGYSGLNYGVEYSQNQINDELRGITSGAIRSADTNGHGTHVAGIAGGDGSETDGTAPAGQYVGVAPGADFIIVKTSLFTSQVAEGVDYIFRRAEDLGCPAVVNLSLGNHYGAHDNSSSFETFLNNLTGPGKLIAVAAGNSRDDAIHAEYTIAGNGSSTTDFNVNDGGTGTKISDIWITVWVDNGDAYNVNVTSPGGTVTSIASPGTDVDETISGEGRVIIENYNAGSHPDGDKEIFIEILEDPGSVGSGVLNGNWSFTLQRVNTGGDGHYDSWIATPSGGYVIFTTNVSSDETISLPATARNVIAVAAHNSKVTWEADNGSSYFVPGFNLGDSSSFSSLGPSRDSPSDPGYQKPDISAPGLVIASAMSGDMTADLSSIMTDGRHRISQGTSQASPHVAGALALFLDKRPDVTPADILEGLRISAWEDSYTGSLPNYTWGYGKMNVLAAMTEFTSADYWNLYE